MTMASPAAVGGVLIGEGGGSGVIPSSSPAYPSAVPSSPSIAASPHWAAQTRRSKARKDDDGGDAGFSPFVAFCFSVNYVLGTGFLTIPWAFVQGGLVLSTISLLVVCVFADVAKDFLLETMARAEAMLDERMRWVQATTTTTTTLSTGTQGRGEIAPVLYSPMLPGPSPSGREGGGDDGADDLTTSEGNPLLLASAASYKSLDLESYPAPRSLPGSLPGSMPGTPNASRHGGGASAPTPGEMRRRMENLNAGRRLMVVANKNGKPPPPRAGYLVRARKFEINALCRVFLGRRGKDAYMLILSAYVYCTLWAYASVFSSAMARQFPLQIPVLGNGEDDDGSYAFYAIAFASVVVPMSCMELHEQVTVQVLLTMCRFLMVFLMVATGGTCAEEQRRRRGGGGGGGDDDEGRSSVDMFRPSGLHRMLPVVVFAMIYHHSIPGLAHPVADKRKLSPIFVSTTTFCALAYCFIGFALGSAFGDDIEQSANLNWASYRGGDEVEQGENDDGAAWWWSWAGMVRMYVVLFPALDVLSAYPLNAITLGNNMLSAFYGRRIHEVETNRWVRIPFRLLASMPPIVLAILVRELGTITDYAGTTGFVLTFSFTALLYVRSRRAAAKRNFSQETYYTTYSSSYFLAYVLFVFGVVMLVFCVVLYVMKEV